jgi:HSP20 family protein
MIKKEMTTEKKANEKKEDNVPYTINSSWNTVKADENAQVNGKKDWLEGEDYAGQLAVDVYQTKDDIVIKSTIAGVKPEDIDISINNDMITIRGMRDKDHEVADQDYFYRECYWGGFSRSIILPCEVKMDRIKATMKNGVLTVMLPKATKVSRVTVVRVKEE